VAWRWRRPRLDAARTTPPFPNLVRAAPPLPQARRNSELPAPRGRELPDGRHLHFHGLDAAEVAAIIQRRPQKPGNGGSENRQRRASVGGQEGSFYGSADAAANTSSRRMRAS
jgi:hypothetical protein